MGSQCVSVLVRECARRESQESVILVRRWVFSLHYLSTSELLGR